MAEQPVSLLLNPVAGRGRAGRRLPQIENLFAAAGIDYEVYLSSAVGDIETVARARSEVGQHTVVVAGGDGSIHEAVNGIVVGGGDTRLGVIPTGTGNDFAKASGISLDWRKATQSLCRRLADRAQARPVDVGRMNDRYFANGAGVGFDAKVTSIARSYRLPIGDLVYLLAIFRGLGAVISPPGTMIPQQTASQIRNNDGVLELLIANPVSRSRICALLPGLVRGRHLGEPEITHASVRRLTIEAESEVPSHLDGEVQAPATRFEIELLPAALHLL